MDSPSPSGDGFNNRALFQRSTDAVFVLNKNRRLRYANPAWESLTGKKLADVYGLHCTSRRSDSPLSALARALHPPSEALACAPARVRRPAPGARLGPPWWEIAYFPLAGPDGLLSIIGTVRIVGSAPALKARAVPELVQQLRNRLPERYRMSDLESDVPACRRVVEQARLASRNLAPLMIMGERGTGKRTLARVIHHGGVTAERTFLTVDCGGLPGPAAEMLLFGAPGLTHPERVGTIVLRDPGCLHRDLQERLLAWIAKQAEPALRVIASFERDPVGEMQSGRIMNELWSTFSIQSIRMTPLRERQEDMPRIIAAMLERFDRAATKKSGGVSDELLETARMYPWPGNLRELDWAIRLAASNASGGMIQPEHLPHEVRCYDSRLRAATAFSPPRAVSILPLDDVLAQAERRLIVLAMGRAGGLQEKAAEMLGIWRARLGRRIKALKIEEKEWQRFMSVEPTDDATSSDRGI